MGLCLLSLGNYSHCHCLAFLSLGLSVLEMLLVCFWCNIWLLVQMLRLTERYGRGQKTEVALLTVMLKISVYVACSEMIRHLQL